MSPDSSHDPAAQGLSVLNNGVLGDWLARRQPYKEQTNAKALADSDPPHAKGDDGANVAHCSLPSGFSEISVWHGHISALVDGGNTTVCANIYSD
jgi:hypothetical protein